MSILDAIRSLRADAPKPKPLLAPGQSLIAPVGVAPQSWQTVSQPSYNQNAHRYRPDVGGSADLDRIVALPRRLPRTLPGDESYNPAHAEDITALVDMMTRRLRKPYPMRAAPCRCAELGRECITELKPAQAWALLEASQVGGLLGPIGVGHGKTGLDILAPMVLPECKLAVLLIPPGLRDQLTRDYHAWAQHFTVPSLVIGEKGYIVPGRPVLHVIPFSLFSRAGSTDILEQLQPDTVIIDEAHKVRHRDTATTSRVMRYLATPATFRKRLLAWSGTLTAKSIRDYAHLAAFSLGTNSPLPLDPTEVECWAQAIDPSDWPAGIGALSALCNRGEHIHAGFHRRLVDTRGVVATKAGAIDAKITIEERAAPPIPPALKDMLRTLRDRDAPGGWTRPDGEELVDILSVQACARQLACGFYYRWKFPKGEPEELILDWFAKRKLWHKELREVLKPRTEHFDSPLLCTKAAIRAYHEPKYEGDLPVWKSEFWPAWRDIRDKVYHETEAVWVDDYLAQDAAQWARENRGIVWYEHEAFGRKVAQLAGVALHGGGPDAEKNILAEDGSRSIVASIKAHGTGRDGLQRLFDRQLVANPPSSGDAWEQLLGRLHRIGQRSPEVHTRVYRHTEEMRDAVDKAVRYAKYIQGTMGTLQKLLSADVGFPIDDDFC